MGWLMLLAAMLALLKLFGVAQGTTATPNQEDLPQVDTTLPTVSVTEQPTKGTVAGIGGGPRRSVIGWREWRRADPTLIRSLWRSKMGNGIRKQLGNAQVYIVLALLIGVVTVVIGCWLSDNCWSPDPDMGSITVA